MNLSKSVFIALLFFWVGVNAYAQDFAEELYSGDGCSVLKPGEGGYDSQGTYHKVVDYDEYPAYQAQGFRPYNNCTNWPYNLRYNFPVIMVSTTPGWVDLDKEKGRGNHDFSCKIPSAFVSDPVNFSVGNTFQEEVDYAGANKGDTHPLEFKRYYNSLTGLWVHSYSAHVIIGKMSLIVVRADGYQTIFHEIDGVISAESSDAGNLVSDINRWVYTSPANEVFIFDSAGRLTSSELGGKRNDISYNNGVVTVVNNRGQSLIFTEDIGHQPRSLSSEAGSVSYSYNSIGRLVSVRQVYSGSTNMRSYSYDDPLDPKLLTSIIDERGIQSVVWAYDSQGRAISTEFSNSIGKVSILYGGDGSTMVTNELGKPTTYRFQTIQGVKRITAIEGEPSPNCPASNSSYTYNDRGQVLTKIDAQGIVTAYTYNDRGLEISRTEASGTPLAKITTTEWDPVRFLRTKLVEPTRTTLYTYDDQGRPLGQQIIAH